VQLTPHAVYRNSGARPRAWSSYEELELGSYGDYSTVRWMYPHRSRQAARDEGRKPTSDSAQHSLADSTP